MLGLEIPDGCFLDGYTDGVSVIIIARNMMLAQTRLDQTMQIIRHWMGVHGLELAKAKIEIMLLTKKRIPKVHPLMFRNTFVQTKAVVKYLGLMLDTRLAFGEHIRG